jgi:hypothetical protein
MRQENGPIQFPTNCPDFIFTYTCFKWFLTNRCLIAGVIPHPKNNNHIK